MERWPPPTYQIRVAIRAPLGFVFRWCTDYDAKDAQRAGEKYERRIIQKTRRRAIYEDLWWESDGWRWRRYEVRLLPPDRWVAESVGNFRDAHIEYRLTEVGANRTQLELRMRRRPGPRSASQPTRVALERELVALWKNFARALERDYRRTK